MGGLDRSNLRSSAPEAVLVRYAPGQTQPWHAHGQSGVSLVVAGSLLEQVGDCRYAARLGSVVAKPAGTVHRNRIGPQGAVLLALRGPGLEPLLERGWRWQIGMGALKAAVALARGEADACARTVAVLDLVRLLGGCGGPAGAAPPPWFAALMERIDSAPAAPSVASLAAEAGVHPAYLTRVFQSRLGCSASAYLRLSRVRRAAELLRSTRLGISEIAVAAGFFDQSHLCRDLRREVGLTPGAYRHWWAEGRLPLGSLGRRRDGGRALQKGK